MTNAAPGALHRPRRDQRPGAGASAQPTDAAPNSATPNENIRRRP